MKVVFPKNNNIECVQGVSNMLMAVPHGVVFEFHGSLFDEEIEMKAPEYGGNPIGGGPVYISGQQLFGLFQWQKYHELDRLCRLKGKPITDNAAYREAMEEMTGTGKE